MLYSNKYAGFKYEIEKEFECGMALVGSQVKEIRAGKMNVKECVVRLTNAELYALNTGLTMDKFKLLLNTYELERIQHLLQEKRYHAFSIGIFTKGRLLKMKIGVGTIKRQYQRTEQQHRKDAKIDMMQKMKKKEFDI